MAARRKARRTEKKTHDELEDPVYRTCDLESAEDDARETAAEAEGLSVEVLLRNLVAAYLSDRNQAKLTNDVDPGDLPGDIRTD